MHFLPHFPIRINPVVLFGLTLLLGLIAGELAKRSKILPTITGYIAVGFIIGPHVFNILTPSLLMNARIFIDLSIGLILFDIGRHLDFAWLKSDPGLLKMGITESFLIFLFTFLVLIIFQIPWLPAALAASIAMATSPAVVLMVANDISSEGPVTRRTFFLTSLNNFFSITLFILLLPFTKSAVSQKEMFLHSGYRIIGSFVLAITICFIIKQIAYLIGKRKENQFVLFAGAVVFTTGVAILLKFSSMLTLFLLGVFARNFDKQHVFTEIDFGWIARLFFILLFVMTGSQLQLTGLWQATAVVLAFVLVRFLAQILSVWLFARVSRLTKQQAFALSFALTPMASVAIWMSNILLEYNRILGYQAMIIITASAAILAILGPIATQLAFIKTGEAVLDKPAGGA